MASRAEWGSDVVVEMMKQYGIEYAPANLGATYRGLLDSIINFGENKTPEIIECLHEEIAVGVAMGYGRATGKPAVALVHNVVGTLHAAMAIYNAYVDRIPVIVMSGTGPMSLKGRRPWIDWVHTALIQGNLVRDYVKWDDQPHDPESVPESFIRAYRVAMTEPKGPVYITLDAGWQEAKLSEPVTIPDISKYAVPTGVQGDPAFLRRTAELLANAESPLIIADHVGRNPEAVHHLVQLAEAGSIPVIDSGGSLNIPSTHPLDVTGSDAITRSDVIVLLDVEKLEQTFTISNRYNRQKEIRIKPDAKIVNIGLFDQWIKSATLDFDRVWPVEFTIAADTNLAIPQLTQELQEIFARNPDRKKVADERYAQAKEFHDAVRRRAKDQLEKDANREDISLAKLSHEVWNCVKGEHWIVTGDIGSWMRNLWELDKPGCLMGGQKAAGLGTALSRSIGAALAVKKAGGFCVAFIGDGESLYVPSSIWTAVHHHIPLLVILLDNGGYVGEGAHVTWTSEHRQRSTANKHIATEIQNPRVDFASLARAQGAYAEGPVENPSDLGPAIQRAFQVMKKESTLALVDVRLRGREQQW